MLYWLQYQGGAQEAAPCMPCCGQGVKPEYWAEKGGCTMERCVIEAAAGRKKAKLVFKNAQVVNVFT